MLKFFSNLFDENKKTINKYSAVVEQINDLEPKFKKLSDAKLAAQTNHFKKIIEQGREQGKI